MITTSTAAPPMVEHRTDTFVRYSRQATSDRCAVFDMDDTLCHYDKTLRLSKCDLFDEREHELGYALSLAQEGIDICIATARPCWTVPKTVQWLERHNVPVAALYVRNRKNSALAPHDLKQGMLQDILRMYEIVSFHDDSPWNYAAAKALGVNAVFVPGNEDYWVEKGIKMGWQHLFQLEN
jgi:hydroxymethylpyrimidine pyrophosphatase-like HAD family hydrolase